MGGKKAGGGFMGIGGESGFLNTGLFSSGPAKIKGFEMSPQMAQYEQSMLQRQNAIAAGQAPSIAQMQFNQNMDQNQRAALAMAASQRGASNPALAFRTAQMASQQANLEGAQQAAILAEQERRKAEELIAAQAAAQRGVAFQQASANLGSKMANQNAQLGAIVGIGQTAGKVATSGAEANMAFQEKQIKEKEKYVDDGSRYIFPAGEAAPGSNIAPAAPPQVDPLAVTQPPSLAPTPSAAPNFVNPSQQPVQAERAPAQVAPIQTSAPNVPSTDAQVNQVFNAAQAGIDDTQKQIEALNAEKSAEIQRKIEEDEKAVEKVDPKGIFDGKSTWQKILGGVGMFLGSLTPEGARNVANMIDKEIDRDIENQKINIKLRQDKKDNRFKLMMEKYGSQEAALLAKKKDAYTALGLHVNRLELNAKNAETRARLAQGAQEIELKKQSINNELAKVMLKQQNEMMKGSVPGFKGYIADPTAAREFRTQLSNAQSAYAEIDNLLKLNDKTGVSLSTSARASAGQSQALLLGQLREILVGPGSMSEGDRTLMEDAIANPTDFFSLASSNKIKLDKLKQSIQRKVDANARAYGLEKDVPRGARKI